jgi:hypothetical protein
MASSDVNTDVLTNALRTWWSLSAPVLPDPEPATEEYTDLPSTPVDKSTAGPSQPESPTSSPAPNAVSNKSVLFKIPLELRENIYTEVFSEESSSDIVDATDSLALEAFRLNSKLYNEAVRIYWKLNALLLNRDTLQIFKYGLSESHLSYVESLRLEID